MRIDAIYPVLGTQDVAAARGFYARLLDLEVSFENDWYASLRTRAEPCQQLALVQFDHESVPRGRRELPAGAIVTIETDDVDALHARACALGLRLSLPLRDEPWGQRHFIVDGPDGVQVDLVQVIPPSPEFEASYRGPGADPLR